MTTRLRLPGIAVGVALALLGGPAVPAAGQALPVGYAVEVYQVPDPGHPAGATEFESLSNKVLTVLDGEAGDLVMDVADFDQDGYFTVRNSSSRKIQIIVKRGGDTLLDTTLGQEGAFHWRPGTAS